MKKKWRRLGNAGVAAVEFAMVSAPFFLLLLGIVELCYMIFVQSVLDGSAREAARMIRTGQVQASGDANADFKTTLCNAVSSLIGCSSLIYQSQVFTDWTTAQTTMNEPPKRDKNGNLIPVGFSAGDAGSIIVVQVTYNRPFFTLWIGNELGGGTQSAFLSSTVVFQNEPYGTGLCSGC